MTNEKEKKEEPRFMVTWQTTPKKTIYNAFELNTLKKPSGNGSGYLRFNPESNTYEKPAAIDALPPRLTKQKVVTNNNER